MSEIIITSTSNKRIKELVALQQKSSLRRQCGVTVVEGERELRHCAASGAKIITLFYCPQIADNTLPLNDFDCEKIVVDTHVYRHVAYRGGTEGVIAIVEPRAMTLDDLRLGDNPLVVVLESVEKPGNLGAVLRSADAAAVDAVIVCDPLTDLYNPNLIRSSIGAIFTVPTVVCSTDECIATLKSKGIKILTAQLQDSRAYYATDMTVGTAIVMGTEATGLSDAWRRAADEHILIPMQGALDSLNVSVSAAILMFEAVRQRHQNKKNRHQNQENIT